MIDVLRTAYPSLTWTEEDGAFIAACDGQPITRITRDGDTWRAEDLKPPIVGHGPTPMDALAEFGYQTAVRVVKTVKMLPYALSLILRGWEQKP